MSYAEQVADQLKDLVVGASYSGSWDHRGESNFLGIHDCWGNVFSVNGAINSGSVEVVDASNLRCHIRYSGNYKRSNYVSPCRHSHDEDLAPSGELIFKITIRLLQGPLITWEETRNLSPVGTMDHDSNGFSVQAVKAAVAGRLTA